VKKSVIVHQPEEVSESRKQVAHAIITSIKKVSDQSGKYRSIAKMAKFTDLKGNDLQQAVKKLSDKEKGEIIKAFAELDRVANAVVSTKV